MVACALLGVPVVDCNPAAQGYLEAFQRVPAAHRALVKVIEVSDEHATGQAHRNGHIRIPAELHEGQLAHEVGHLVAWSDSNRLGELFEAWFWPNGNPRRGKPSSDYAARQGPAEDFAETYRRLWRGDAGTVRIEWLRDKLRDAHGQLLYRLHHRAGS